MSKINCPKCNKHFRTETGFQWHMQRMHRTVNPQGQIGATLPENLRQGDPKSPNDQKIESSIEIIKARLDFHTKRDAWLSDRISQLESHIRHNDGSR